MAERKRSQDGSKDTEKVITTEGEIDQAGRSGGDLSRDIGTRDEKQRTNEKPAGVTRVTDSDKPEDD